MLTAAGHCAQVLRALKLIRSIMMHYLRATTHEQWTVPARDAAASQVQELGSLYQGSEGDRKVRLHLA